MSYFRRPSDSTAKAAFFPTFLAPSLPFRSKSRHGSSDSTSSTSSTSTAFSALSEASTATSASTSSNPFFFFSSSSSNSNSGTTILPASTVPIIAPTSQLLSGHSSRLHCATCSTDLCLTSQIISKGFTGRHGRAYLVQGHPSHVKINASDASLPNTYQSKAVPRNLVTGQHTVSDISCAICGTVLGWKYVEAREDSQKYKVGKFILETKRIRVGVNWEHDEETDRMAPVDEQTESNCRSKNEVEFDSQDEDECEDLFAGVWSPRLAEKRRNRRMRFGNRGRVGSAYVASP